MWKGGTATTLAARKAQLQQTRQQLADLAARAGRVVLLGAGLVGVELAAELVEYFPQLRMRDDEGVVMWNWSCLFWMVFEVFEMPRV